MPEPHSEATPVIEVTVAAPIGDVWRALRDPDALHNWHGWEYSLPDGVDALAAEIQTIYFNPAVVEQPPTRLALGMDVFDLAETDDGVRVRITRPPRGANPDWDAYYDDITEGWRTFLHQLKWAVERHPGKTRVTHFAAGTPHAPGSIVDRMGLGAIAERPVGNPYAATLPMGLDITGTVFFRTEHQLGLTVTEWGNGLLVIFDSAPAEHRPAPEAAAILSIYDLPDDAVTELRTVWDDWWNGEFQPVAPPGEAPRDS